MPKAVTKTVVRATMAVATGGISEAVRAGQSLAKGDIIGAATGLAGGLGVSSAAGAVADSQIKSRMVAAATSGISQSIPKNQVAAEQKTEADTQFDERRRRSLLAKQGSLIRTSPLGAAIKDQSTLGGPRLAGY